MKADRYISRVTADHPVPTTRPLQVRVDEITLPENHERRQGDTPSVVARVVLAGDFDFRSVSALDRVMEPLIAAVISPTPHLVSPIVLDLREVDFIDSGGLGALIGYWKQIKGRLRLMTQYTGEGMQRSQVERALYLTQIDRLMPIDSLPASAGAAEIAAMLARPPAQTAKTSARAKQQQE